MFKIKSVMEQHAYHFGAAKMLFWSSKTVKFGAEKAIMEQQNSQIWSIKGYYRLAKHSILEQKNPFRSRKSLGNQGSLIKIFYR